MMTFATLFFASWFVWAQAEPHGVAQDTPWMTLTGEVVLIGIVAGAVLISYLRTGRQGILNEEARVKRIGDLENRVNTLTDQQFKCKESEAKLVAENVAQRAELGRCFDRIRALETATGTGPKSPTPGLFAINYAGKIVLYSPSLLPILGWLPEEVDGKDVATVCAGDLHDKLMEAAAGMNTMGKVPDQARAIVAYCIAKSSARIPVEVHLKGLPAEKLLAVEVRERVEAKAGG